MAKQSNSNLDHERYSLATRLVIIRYWRQAMKTKRFSIPALILPAFNNILIAYIPPLAIASIVSLATKNSDANISDFLPYIALFGGSWLLGEILMRIGIHFLIKAEVIGVKQLYNDSLSSILRQDLTFFHDNFAGSLTKKTTGFVNRFIDTMNIMSLTVLNRILPALFAAVVLWFYSPWLVLCLFSWLALAITIVVPLVRHRQKLVTARETATNVVSGHIADIYGNIDAVRAHASEDIELKRSNIFVKDLIKKQMASWNFQNLRADIIIGPIYVATNVSGLLLGIYLAQNGIIEFTSLIVVFAYYAQVTGFMWQFNDIYRNLETALSDAAQFTELLLTEPKVQDNRASARPQYIRGGIEFDDVHFRYEDSSKELFNNFSLSINPGEKIGLVGRSGGGKTSITKLLLRFSDINKGSIAIDGIDIRDYTQRDLRELISYVPQEPAMFHRTIAENISYGKPNATQKEIEAAAKKAHAHEFILGLPDGYKTMVGERGVKLSGGQRQRVAIARAVLKDAPILLLDEATSALDSESERLIQDALQMLMKGKTTIIIAHRLSTIQNMDRIVALDRGTIVEQGTHNELINKGGIYAELWAHQSGGFIEE